MAGKLRPGLRSTIGKTGVLTGFPMHRIDVWRMIRRRVADAGMSVEIGCHTFRATGITAIPRCRRHARECPGDGSARKPTHDKDYRTADVIRLDEVERIVI